jgi:hypothetical protein
VLSAGPIDFTIEDHPVRLIGLDASEPRRHDGTPTMSKWPADTTLRADPDTPTLLFLHYPPLLTRLAFDALRLHGADGLRAVIEGHPQLTQIVAGHVHPPSPTTGAPGDYDPPSTTHQNGAIFIQMRRRDH